MSSDGPWQVKPTPSEVLTRNYSSLAALVFLLWEGLVTCQHEYQYIWKGRTSGIKWTYLYLRYFALCSQTINVCVIFGVVSHPPVRTQFCHAWFFFQIFSVQSLLSAIEAILMLRVYALYNRNSWVGWFLGTLFSAETIAHVLVEVGIMRDARFDLYCLARETPRKVIYFGAGVVFTHSVIWTMTLLRRSVAVRSGWGHIPVVNLVFRDGAYIFICICAVFTVIIPYSFLVQVLAHVVFSLLLAILSVAACRLIMNMQRLKVEEAAAESEFTTNILLTDHSSNIANSGNQMLSP